MLIFHSLVEKDLYLVRRALHMRYFTSFRRQIFDALYKLT